MPGQQIDHDEFIIRMLASDDDRAVKILFEQYYDLLSDVLYQSIHDRDTGDDIIQELLLNIWLKRKSINLRPPLSHYLVRAAMNRGKNYKRNRLRTREILTFDFKEFENLGLSIPADSDLEIRDIKNLWKEAKKSMKPRTRIIFTLSRKRSMTYKEIALHLGISVKTVEKNLSQALRILHEFFKPYLKAIIVMLALPMD